MAETESAPTPAPGRRDDGSIEFKLSKPITSAGESKDTIIFREPTVNDIYEIGDPTNIIFDGPGGSGRIVVNDKTMIEMMARLSGMQLQTLRNLLKIGDYQMCKLRVQDFFIPTLPTS